MDILANITRVHPEATLPTYATSGSIGFDLPLLETLTVPAHGTAKTRTGLIIRVPPGYGLFLFPRSSTFGKTGLLLANTVGVVDQDFCGPADELQIQLWNPQDRDVTVEKGTRLVQGVFLPTVQAVWKENPIETTASRGGFGSTGK